MVQYHPIAQTSGIAFTLNSSVRSTKSQISEPSRGPQTGEVMSHELAGRESLSGRPEEWKLSVLIDLSLIHISESGKDQ